MSTMNVEERLEEQEEENIELKQTKVEVLETANIQHVKNTASLEEKCQNKIVGEAENEIVAPIHQMKVQLPLENWYDLLAFVPRRQLGNLVSEIGDRQFAWIIQPFLHGFGKIKLPAMFTDVPGAGGPTKVHLPWPNNAVDIPDWPMPGNIINFKDIELNYLDASILNFLEKFHKNSLLTNVNLYLQNFEWNQRTLAEDEAILLRVLTKIAPFITSIDSIESIGIDLFGMLYNNNTNHGNSNESLLQWMWKGMMEKTRILMKMLYNNTNTKLQLLLKEMMAEARILMINWHDFGTESPLDKIAWFCSWFYTPRNDSEPRMLQFDHNDYYYRETGIDLPWPLLIERIKKDFQEANHAISFFIYAIIRRNNNIEDIFFEKNVKTNEKLVVKKANHDENWEKLLIARYPLEAEKNRIRANVKEITEWDRETLDRTISLDLSMPIVL